MTRVCVAISVRNGEAFLAEAIESVLSQSHGDLELRVYDNGSADRSAAIVHEYLTDRRVSYTANARDIGYYGSLNRALAETRAPLFVPFAADDVMEPANLQLKVAALRRTGAAFAHSPVHLLDEAGGIIGELGRQQAPRELYPAPEFFRLCAPVNCITCPAVVVGTAELRSIGGFDGRLPYCADWYAWMRLALRHGVAYVDRHLVGWRQHADSGTTDSLRSAVYATEDPAALASALDDPALPAGWEPLRAPMLAACLARMATHLERDGHRRAAAGGHAGYALAGRALCLAPTNQEIRGLFTGQVARAGLTVPALPFDAVALPACEPEEVAAAIDHARLLDGAGLLAGFALGTRPSQVEQMVALVEPLLAAGPELGIDLVPSDDASELWVPGSVALAPFGSPQAADAEARGVPALLHSMPEPFSRPAEPHRFETLRMAA
ncbi:MAG TPA: glycosyltransferase [Gaiellales bacterium]|nr:glycosyltransferase [Gaiellales bacterium]